MEDIKVEKDILNILLSGEEVLYSAQQSRVKRGGSFTTPDKIYVTNYRVIYRDPSMLGLKKYINDYHFKDISNVRMKKGVLSTEIYLNSRFESDEVVISGLSHEDAEIVVRLIRNGIYGNFPEKEPYYSDVDERFNEMANEKGSEDNLFYKNQLKSREKKNTNEILSNLERLNELKKSNVITLEEFNNLKKRILEESPNGHQYEDNNEESKDEVKYCKECGNILDYVKEGEYRGDYVKFFKCGFCNKTYAKKIE